MIGEFLATRRLRRVFICLNPVPALSRVNPLPQGQHKP
ncbi:hypothetical protein RK21_03314 [Pseudomonas plecoglossicida]|nr:hypothetical protein RK21_03314 [Pseudomonas plecoglossicida]